MLYKERHLKMKKKNNSQYVTTLGAMIQPELQMLGRDFTTLWLQLNCRTKSSFNTAQIS